MVEEDLFFPGNPPGNDNYSDNYSEHRRSRSESIRRVLEKERHDRNRDTDLDTDHSHEDAFSLETDSAGSHRSNDSHDITTARAFPLTPRSGSPLPMQIRDLDATIAEDDDEDKEEEVAPNRLAQVYSNPPLRPLAIRKSFSTPLPTNPPPSRQLPPPLSLKTPSLSSQHFGLHLPSRPLSQSKFSGSSISLLSSLGSHAEPPESKSRPRGYSSTSPPASARPASAVTVVNQHQHRPSPSSLASPSSKSPPFLLRTLQKPPANPRDHTLLEMIYTEMHGSRFINLVPLSLLANLLALHFRGGFIFNASLSTLLTDIKRRRENTSTFVVLIPSFASTATPATPATPATRRVSQGTCL